MGTASSLNLPRPFGPYELVRQLAVGGMAEVFVARARSVAGFEKIVALKTIHPRFSEDPEFARLLVEEANITAQLSHRNIVQVIDLGQIDATHYIAMEYVDGLDLSRLLAKMRERGQRCSPRFAAYVVREICDGLEHAHRKVGSDGKPLKIIHRDVSPPNILVSSAGEVKLTDFGIAKAALRASSTEAGVVKGKYAYMPPEQAKGQPLDPRADVFSAGCVLYELATGQPVYKDAPLPALLDRVSRGVFDAPEKVRADLPPQLVGIIKKALSVSADGRYPSARAMADELNAFLYTLPPNPEFEVSQIVSGVTDASRASMPPMAGTSLFDDDSDVSTQIESVAAMRSKMNDPAPGNTAKIPTVNAAPKPSAPDPDAFNDEPTRAMPRGKFAGILDGAAPVDDDDEPEPTVQGVRPNTAAPRVMDNAPRPAAGRPASPPMASATASSKPAMPVSSGPMKGAPPPAANGRPGAAPAAEPKLPARRPTLMGAAVAPISQPVAPAAPAGSPRKVSLPPPPPPAATARKPSLPPPPPPGARGNGPPPMKAPALPTGMSATASSKPSPPPMQSKPAQSPMQHAPAMQQPPMQHAPAMQQHAPAMQHAPPMQHAPAMQSPMQSAPAMQSNAFGSPPPQQQPSNAFGSPPQQSPYGAQPNAFGNAPATSSQGQQFGYPQQQQGAPNFQSTIAPGATQTAGFQAQQAADEADAKQRRAVIIAGAFAFIGVAALVVVLLSGR